MIMSSGRIAIFGIGKMIATIGLISMFVMREKPIAVPMMTPGMTPTRNPMKMRLRLTRM
jgi:hypothetical protein